MKRAVSLLADTALSLYELMGFISRECGGSGHILPSR